jgi:hypothetical protein
VITKEIANKICEAQTLTASCDRKHADHEAKAQLAKLTGDAVIKKIRADLEKLPGVVAASYYTATIHKFPDEAGSSILVEVTRDASNVRYDDNQMRYESYYRYKVIKNKESYPAEWFYSITETGNIELTARVQQLVSEIYSGRIKASRRAEVLAHFQSLSGNIVTNPATVPVQEEAETAPVRDIIRTP